MRPLAEHRLPFTTPQGAVVAHLVLTPERGRAGGAASPLVELDEAEARGHGETSVQLKEGEAYEYQVAPVEAGRDLRLRCALAKRRASLKENGTPDAGRLVTGNWCGTLVLELVEGPADLSKPPAASALIEVRSLKMDYRSQYRGMLRRISGELADLVVDARSAAKAPLRSSFMERTDTGWLQIQLELLREVLDSFEFSAAMRRILAYPHERLSDTTEARSPDRPMRWGPAAVRQLITGQPRRDVPTAHPLRTRHGLASIAARVEAPRRTRDLDTPENRFVKFALGEFRAFLAHAEGVFERAEGWEAAAALCRRLAAPVDEWLGRSLFREVGALRWAPLGSPVLQRKAGYREMLRWWLRFRTAAELSWEGGADLFRAGPQTVGALLLQPALRGDGRPRGGRQLDPADAPGLHADLLAGWV